MVSPHRRDQRYSAASVVDSASAERLAADKPVAVFDSRERPATVLVASDRDPTRPITSLIALKNSGSVLSRPVADRSAIGPVDSLDNDPCSLLLNIAAFAHGRAIARPSHELLCVGDGLELGRRGLPEALISLMLLNDLIDGLIG